MAGVTVSMLTFFRKAGVGLRLTVEKNTKADTREWPVPFEGAGAGGSIGIGGTRGVLSLQALSWICAVLWVLLGTTAKLSLIASCSELAVVGKPVW